MGNKLKSRSFLLGVSVTSLTWLVVIYLYWTISKEPIAIIKLPTNYINPILHSDQLPDKALKSKFASYEGESKKLTNDINSLDDSEDIFNKKVLNGKGQPIKITNAEDNSDGVYDVDMLADMGLVKTLEDQTLRQHGFQAHAFNALISSRLSLHRSIPDTRHKRCTKLKYPKSLPNTSVVICFYKELLSALLRTVHSILDRSPAELIHEIILVDDSNDETYHSEVLEAVTEINGKINLIRTSQREGLIRARVFGARKATGQVLVFLDSHVEVNTGWLEPLLNRISENHSTVVTPIIDVISPDTFKYSASPLVRGGFNWGLHFRWDSIPLEYFTDKSNFVRPIRSATMAGGLFAINRDYFTELGEYDLGMDIWGGENLEMSFRIWMCGGQLEIIPCSRVGHIFRRRRPYGDPNGGDSMLRNSLRVAHVWMDEYKENFFQTRPEGVSASFGDISQRVELRKRLKCHNFSWYLQSIYPQLEKEKLNGDEVVKNVKPFQAWNKKTRNYKHKWQIRLTGTSYCLESEEDTSHRGSRFVLSPCASMPRQIFHQTDRDELILDRLLCLEAADDFPRLGKCHEMGGSQEWIVKEQMGVALYNVATGLCLSADESSQLIGSYVHMAICSNPSKATWDLVDVN